MSKPTKEMIERAERIESRFLREPTRDKRFLVHLISQALAEERRCAIGDAANMCVAHAKRCATRRDAAMQTLDLNTARSESGSAVDLLNAASSIRALINDGEKGDV